MELEGLQLGQYRLLRLIGSGGMGQVFLAEDARINQQVAIKIGHTEATPYPTNSTNQNAVRLFQREARAIAKLDHPHILPLFSYGEETVNGMLLIYIVMPYRPEGSFANWLLQRSDNELLSVQDVAYFISQAAEALQYAHDNQIVHQDVKPHNFLIRTHKDHPNLPDLLLADFGIARLSSSTSNISHSVRGTPTYMAPEQWSGEPVYATDQYALAVFAYELLTGRPPFVGRQEQVMYQHFNVQPQSPSLFNPQLSTDVDAVILKALAKRPEDRFPSISVFANTFQQATQDLDASTIIKTPSAPNNPNLRVKLAISTVEAQTGTNRLLTLPGGRQVSISVPAGSYNGQVLHFTEMGEPLYNAGPAGSLILTLAVQETDGITDPAQQSQLVQTVPSSPLDTSGTTVIPPDERNTPSKIPPSSNLVEPPPSPPVKRLQGISTGTAIVLVGLAFLIIVGGIGFLFLYNMSRSSSNTATTTQSGNTSTLPATSITQTNIPTATATAPATAIPTKAPPSSNYVQLKSFYSGTASGYADASITLTLKSEDQQGNVTMQTTFQLLDGSQKIDIYSCQGSVTTDRHISLQCTTDRAPSYLLTVQGYVYPDGHMEGTETATATNDPTYNHVYQWKAY